MSFVQIDAEGYRLGVGIVMLNDQGQVFWAARCDQENAWQFPQGGIHEGESVRDALYRELQEEVGLVSSQVTLLAESETWHAYQLPKDKQIVEGRKVAGQKQRWFLLRLLAEDTAIQLNAVPHPEFKQWRWVDYWDPLQAIVSFKQAVYKKVLIEFANQAKPR